MRARSVRPGELIAGAVRTVVRGRGRMRGVLAGVVAAAFLATIGPAVAAPAPTTGLVATRADVTSLLHDRSGRLLDGRGTSIAIIDTGIDPSHPAFALPGGGSKVVQLLSAAPCLRYGEDVETIEETSDDPSCVTPVPAVNADTGQGGHGSMIGGILVGDAYRLRDGTRVGGVAPGARLVVISVTTALVGVDNAFAWVLAHHAAPCGAGVPASTCPPIRVINASWGADSPVIRKLEDRLAAAGVITVWANGNTGGTGSTDNSNPDATDDPTPGIISVASYDDLGTGSRSGKVASTSSRGAADHPATWPTISAPGENVISSCRAYQAVCPSIETGLPRSGPGATDFDTYFTGSGTSFAAPEVGGVIALLYQVDPAATPAGIEAALESTAHRFSDGAPYRQDGRYLSSFDKGTGLVDAYAAALDLGAR